MTLTIRDLVPDDFDAACDMLNHIIAVGGTTAYEVPFDRDSFRPEFFDGPVLRLVAMDGARLVGLQVCYDCGDGVLGIGSFAEQRDPVKGTGRTLFAETCRRGRDMGFRQIQAVITVDNAPGLGYYGAMGFIEVERRKDDASRNGAPIDRVVKVYDL